MSLTAPPATAGRDQLPHHTLTGTEADSSWLSGSQGTRGPCGCWTGTRAPGGSEPVEGTVRSLHKTDPASPPESTPNPHSQGADSMLGRRQGEGGLETRPPAAPRLPGTSGGPISQKVDPELPWAEGDCAEKLVCEATQHGFLKKRRPFFTPRRPPARQACISHAQAQTAWKTCPHASLPFVTQAKPRFPWPKPSSPPPATMTTHAPPRNEIHVFLNHLHSVGQKEHSRVCPGRRLPRALPAPSSLSSRQQEAPVGREAFGPLPETFLLELR